MRYRDEELIQGKKKTVRDVCDSPIFEEEKMANIMQEIGKKVKRYCVIRGYKLEELAAVANISVTAIYKIENGMVGDFRVSTLIKLALSLDISLDELVSLESESSKRDSLGKKIDAMTEECDIVTKNMILKSVAMLVELSKALIRRGLLKSSFNQEEAFGRTKGKADF